MRETDIYQKGNVFRFDCFSWYLRLSYRQKQVRVNAVLGGKNNEWQVL